MRVQLTTMAALLIASPCAANDLPEYDIQLHCKATTALFGDNQRLLLDSCAEAERKSKKQVGARLNEFDDKTFKHCDAMSATTAGGSYQVFAGCLAMDVANRFLEGKIDIIPAKQSPAP